MILPIEVAHYNQWAWRLEVELAALFPRTRWHVPRLHERTGLPRPAGIPPWYRIVARTPNGTPSVVALVKVTPLVNEATNTRLLIALGRELEQLLKTLREEP